MQLTGNGSTATPLPATPDDALACFSDNAGDMLGSCVFPQLVGATGGEALFGIFIGGFTLASFWAAGGRDLRVPAVLTVLFGGLLFPLLPADMQGIAYSVVIVAIAAGAYAVQRGRL